MVGLVRGIHGLRGAVRVEVLTDDPARFEAGARLFPEGSDEQLTVDWSQSDGPGILIRFRERPDRAAVEPLRDRYLEALVSADDRPPDSWYWHEVLGVTVTTSTGEDLGKVSDIFRTGGSEVFVVEGPRGEVLVPAVAQRVRGLRADRRSHRRGPGGTRPGRHRAPVAGPRSAHHAGTPSPRAWRSGRGAGDGEAVCDRRAPTSATDDRGR